MDVDRIFASLKSQPQEKASPKQRASGFPSPAEDFAGQVLSLDRHLVRRPAATYFCQVTGDAMQAAGIYDGDLLVVDSSLTPRHEQVVVALLFGELVVRRLHQLSSSAWLVAEPAAGGYPPVEITHLESADLFWGVVTWVLHQP